jgi:hypothetical protein
MELGSESYYKGTGGKKMKYKNQNPLLAVFKIHWTRL